jgi:hypothetical protein
MRLSYSPRELYFPFTTKETKKTLYTYLKTTQGRIIFMTKKVEPASIEVISPMYQSREVEILPKGTEVQLRREEIIRKEAVPGFEDLGSRDFNAKRIRIIHKLSHECTEGDPLYIEKAKQGMFIDSITKELYTSLTVIPCIVLKDWVEKAVGKVEGGFIKSHGANDSISFTCTKDEKKRLILPNGNELQENANWFLWLLEGFSVTEQKVVEIDSPAILTLSSTRLQSHRDWTTKAKYLKIVDENGNSVRARLFDAYYKLNTQSSRNERGTWAALQVSYVGRTNELERAQSISEAVEEYYQEAKRRMSSVEAREELMKERYATTDDDIPF